MNEEYSVTKSNNLIMSKYDLSLQEQKLILVLASMIEPNDKDFKIYELSIKSFSELLELKNNDIYKQLDKITDSLLTKRLYIRERGGWTKFNWLSSAKYLNGEGKILMRFDPFLKPYLIGLNNFFTTYKLENILSLKSKYTIRIFEILKSNIFKNNMSIEIEEFKNLIGATKKTYELYGDFKRNILVKSQNEIKEKTDISFEFEEIKTGRRVTALKFYIKENKKNKNLKHEKILDFNGDEITLINKRTCENENIKELKILFENQVSVQNINKILVAANEDIEKIKKVYEYSKTQKIENLVGFMIKMVKDDNFQEPIKKDKNNSKIHNFSERDDYDYEKLEEGLLGWSNDEEEIDKINFYNNNIENEGVKMDSKAKENIKDIKYINEIKEVLEGQLIAIFGELKYRTWIKPSIDNIEIENNDVKFIFSNDFVKNKFENEFENIIKEIIKGIDNILEIEKIIKK